MSASQTRTEGPRLPTRAEVIRASKATAAILADPDATLADLYPAAEAEAATFHAYEHRHGAQVRAELEREIEAGI